MDCLAGAGVFEPRYGELESDALACPRGAAEPLFVEIHNSLETFGFREPYRICGVQSFGEKWAIWRIMSAPCRVGVRSANEKSLPLLGLIAHNSRGEYAASVKLAERVGFELLVRLGGSRDRTSLRR